MYTHSFSGRYLHTIFVDYIYIYIDFFCSIIIICLHRIYIYIYFWCVLYMYILLVYMCTVYICTLYTLYRNTHMLRIYGIGLPWTIGVTVSMPSTWCMENGKTTDILWCFSNVSVVFKMCFCHFQASPSGQVAWEVQISSEASWSNEKKHAIFDHFRDRAKMFTDTQRKSKMPTGNPDV